MKYGFGIDLGGTTVKLAYFDQAGTMLDKWEIPTRTENGGEKILPDIAASVQEYLVKHQISRGDIIGLGIGVPGPVDGKGVVNGCVNLGWGSFNVSATLSELTGFPVMAGNDANVAALGEYWKGGAQGCDNMMMVTLGTGVGAGIVVDGRVVHGTHGAGGEVGHMVINPLETEHAANGDCGTVEQYCSATGVVFLAKRALAACSSDSVLRRKENFTCKDVFDAAAAGDSLAAQVLEQVYGYLGLFLAAVCCTVDPEAVVIGGGVSRAGQPLLEGLSRYYKKYAFHAVKDVRFALASLGNDAGAYGAFKLALSEYGE